MLALICHVSTPLMASTLSSHPHKHTTHHTHATNASPPPTPPTPTIFACFSWKHATTSSMLAQVARRFCNWFKTFLFYKTVIFDKKIIIIKRHLQVYATYYSKFGTFTWDIHERYCIKKCLCLRISLEC